LASQKAKEDAETAKTESAAAEAMAKNVAMRTWKVALRGLIALVEEKMAGSVVYDKFWVQGTCTKTFKITKQVLRIHAQLAKIAEAELAEQETWFAGIVQRELEIRNGTLVADDDAELLGDLAAL